MRALERKLLDAYQRGLPLCPRPYAEMAERLGVGEQDVIDALENLKRSGVIGRVGAVVRPNSIGASTLAAMQVPSARLAQVADLVSAYREVNHNYEREHAVNLWFVVTAEDQQRVDAVIAGIKAETGLPVLNMPMLEGYHLDLGFDLQWN